MEADESHRNNLIRAPGASGCCLENDQEEDDVSTWDALVGSMDGDLLQSTGWGVFKRQHGWQVEQVATTNDACAQILFRHIGPFSQAYLPRGPVVPQGGGDSLELLEGIDAVCRRHRAISLIVEPARQLPDAWMESSPAFTRMSSTIQSSRTVVVDVLQEDAAILRDMRKDTRYNIGYAQRYGMEIDEPPISDESIDLFYSLIEASAHRKDFGIHDRAYYRDFLRTFADESVLLFARTGEAVTAALIAARFGRGARSMYAGALGSQGSRGDTALLRLEAMRWARRQGCTTYDLGGIAPTAGDDSGLQGVERFKTGFGGEIVAFPSAVERVYHPRLAILADRFWPMLLRRSE